MQVARCLEFGLLVPQDSEAAFREYKSAAALGSPEGSLRCGIHFFEGTAPGGQSCANACICSWLLGGLGGLMQLHGHIMLRSPALIP